MLFIFLAIVLNIFAVSFFLFDKKLATYRYFYIVNLLFISELILIIKILGFDSNSNMYQALENIFSFSYIFISFNYLLKVNKDELKNKSIINAIPTLGILLNLVLYSMLASGVIVHEKFNSIFFMCLNILSSLVASFYLINIRKQVYQAIPFALIALCISLSFITSLKEITAIAYIASTITLYIKTIKLDYMDKHSFNFLALEELYQTKLMPKVIIVKLNTQEPNAYITTYGFKIFKLDDNIFAVLDYKDSKRKLNIITHPNSSCSKKMYHFKIKDKGLSLFALSNIKEVLSNKLIFENIIYEDDVSLIKEERYILNILKEAISNEEILTFYQPIYSTEEKKFTSVEILARLYDKKNDEIISPDIFIPVAQKYKLINEIDLLVLKNACQLLNKTGLLSNGLKVVEFNISGSHISSPDVVENIKNIIRPYNLPASCFNIEITEQEELTTEAISHIKELKNLGFTISLDDFGTGFANISKIKENKFDIIKLDKSLIFDAFALGKNSNAFTLMNDSISLCKNQGCKIVAEGIETKQTAIYLSSNGINFLQGFYFSKPINEQDYINFMLSNNL